MSVTLRCPPVPRETRKKTGVTVLRAIICHPAVAAAGGRRADCCSSLSPISDCFFKAPVAEDINYPTSVNHVIYRPHPRGPRETEGENDGGREGEGWGGRGNGGEDRGRCSNTAGVVLHDMMVLHRCQPSKTPVGCSPRPQQYPARHSRNLSATRPKLSSRPVAAAFNGATRSPAFT